MKPFVTSGSSALAQQGHMQGRRYGQGFLDGQYGPRLHAKASELRRGMQVLRALMCRMPSRAQTRQCLLGGYPRLATQAKEAIQAMWARPSQQAQRAQRWTTASLHMHVQRRMHPRYA